MASHVPALCDRAAQVSRLRRLCKRSSASKSRRLAEMKAAAREAGWDVSPRKSAKDPRLILEKGKETGNLVNFHEHEHA